MFRIKKGVNGKRKKNSDTLQAAGGNFSKSILKYLYCTKYTEINIYHYRYTKVHFANNMVTKVLIFHAWGDTKYFLHILDYDWK